MITATLPSNVIHVRDPRRLRAGLDAVMERAKAIKATTQELAEAKRILLAEMDAGRSTACAIALANSHMKRCVLRSVPGHVA